MTPPSPQSSSAPACEAPGYLDHCGSQLYYVLHEAQGVRRGLVVIAGPFGAERERAYTTCVLWARALASRGFDVLRFDYRGMGESTGRFEDMTFSAWREDLDACIAMMRRRDEHAPVIVQGVRAGAILAAEAFDAGAADSLMMWCPPTGAREHLYDILRRTLTSDMLANPQAPRKTRDAYIAELDRGRLINIDGYFWSRNLWLDAARHPLARPGAQERRPWKSVDVNPSARAAADAVPATQTPQPDRPRMAVQADRFWESQGFIITRTQALFAASLTWLDTAIEAAGTIVA